MNNEIEQLERQLIDLKAKLSEARRRAVPEPVQDYQLQTPAGPVTLSELFEDKDDLIVIHNMGKGCAYCTLWADGFMGLLPHLENRAAFVVVSPDDAATQAAFAESRGWTFKLASAKGSSFVQDMGFASASGFMPGVSAFHRAESGTIARTGKTFFGPGDDFCAVWPFFELLRGGAGNWGPRLRYEAEMA